MRKRIVRSFLWMYVFSMSVAFLFLYMMVYNMYLQDEISAMENTIDLIELNNLESVKLQEYLENTNSRLTIIEADDGEVVYENIGYVNEDHLERQEVQQALENGTGDAIRYSESMHQEYLYTAKYNEEEGKVYRLSMPFYGISQSVSTLLPYFLASFAIGLAIAWFLSDRMASTILHPIREISRRIQKATRKNEPLVFPQYKYKELQDITSVITDMDVQIRSHIRKLDEEKQIRQEFFSNASHELKTPLTSILGYSELVTSGTIQDEAGMKMCMEQIQQEATRMSRLIQDILTISRLESSDTRVISTHFQMKDLLEGVLQRLESFNKLHCTIEAKCEDLTVYASEDYLEVLLINLISNALKYNRENGKVMIDIRKKNRCLSIKVEDTGIGISEEDQKHVFERFFRADRQRARTIPGTGLGLSIVKHVAEYYDGEILFRSREGKGTCMIVRLPVLVRTN